MGIRPEDLEVVTGERLPADTPAAGLQGRVLLVERLGGTSHIHLEVGPHRLIASVSNEQLPDVGEDVTVHVHAERAHMFGADGRALFNLKEHEA